MEYETKIKKIKIEEDEDKAEKVMKNVMKMEEDVEDDEEKTKKIQTEVVEKKAKDEEEKKNKDRKKLEKESYKDVQPDKSSGDIGPEDNFNIYNMKKNSEGQYIVPSRTIVYEEKEDDDDDFYSERDESYEYNYDAFLDREYNDDELI